MNNIITVKYDDSKVRKYFNKLPEEMKNQVGGEMFEYCKRVQRNARLMLTLNQTRDPQNPVVYDSIQAKMLSRNQSVVTISQAGLDLDHKPAHFEDIRNRNLLSWARRKLGSKRITGKTSVYGLHSLAPKGEVYVTPHPFINQALEMSNKGLRSGLNRAVNRALAKAKA